MLLSKETLIESWFEIILEFWFKARKGNPRIASYLRIFLTKLWFKIHIISNSLIRSAFPYAWDKKACALSPAQACYSHNVFRRFHKYFNISIFPCQSFATILWLTNHSFFAKIIPISAFTNIGIILHFIFTNLYHVGGCWFTVYSLRFILQVRLTQFAQTQSVIGLRFRGYNQTSNLKPMTLSCIASCHKRPRHINQQQSLQKFDSL